MKILLIYAVTENVNIPVLPLGLGCIAAASESAGCEVRVFNATEAPESLDALVKEIAAFGPEVIGISARNVDDQDRRNPRFLLGPVKHIVRACKTASSASIVLGGAGFTMFPSQALEFAGADMGVAGQGEDSFIQLLECLGRGSDISRIPGIVLPGVPFQGPLARVKNLDAWPLPEPERHILIPDHWNRRQVFVPVQSRRGCALDCAYCSTKNIEGRRLARRSPALVARSIRAFQDKGFSNFFLVDNTFNLPPSYAHALCGALISDAPGITFRAIVYPAPLKEDLAAQMAAAGCVEVSLGFEHGDAGMLQTYNKHFDRGAVQSAAALLKKHGIRRMGFLLLGGPGETRESVKRAFDFVEELGLDSVKVTAGIRIYPHTAMHQAAIKAGALAPDQDLLRPAFFVEPAVAAWLDDSVEQWKQTHPDWTFY